MVTWRRGSLADAPTGGRDQVRHQQVPMVAFGFILAIARTPCWEASGGTFAAPTVPAFRRAPCEP